MRRGIWVMDLGTASKTLAELVKLPSTAGSLSGRLCQERSVSTLDKSLISVLQCCILQ